MSQKSFNILNLELQGSDNCVANIISDIKVKGKVSPLQPMWPRGVQEVKALRFIDTRHMKVVRSSPLRTGRLYPQEYPGTHF